MTDFNDAITGKFFTPSNIYGEVPKFGYYRDEINTHAFGVDGARVGGFPLRNGDIALVSNGRMGSLNLIDYILEDDVYINGAFVRAQTALLATGLRGLYVPGDRVYLLDPAREIQLVLDDLHIWGENNPIFYSTAALLGYFQVVYAHRVRIEGVSVVLDPNITRTDPTGTYAGAKYNGRRSAFGTYDSNDFSLNNVYVNNMCGAFIGKGYHSHVDYTTWKALAPAVRVTTPFDLTNVNSLERSPELARSLVRAGGYTKIERVRSEHCDFAVLYNNQENITLYDIDCRDTTITQAHPHAVYAAGNLVYNVYKNGVLSNPLLPENTLLKDGTNGVCKATKLRSIGNTHANAFKFRIHDQVTVSDVYAEDTGGGVSFINCDGAVLDGGTMKDMRGGTGGDGDDEDDDPDEVFGYGLRVNGCRGGTFKNLSIYMAPGVPEGSALYVVDVLGGNQRRNTSTGELFYSDRNLIEDIFVRTNYANADPNRDFDPTSFDPESIVAQPIVKVGANNNLLTNTKFRNIEHRDAWGHYPSTAPMFSFLAGTHHKIDNPLREGTANLLEVAAVSGNHYVSYNPELLETATIVDEGSPATKVSIQGSPWGVKFPSGGETATISVDGDALAPIVFSNIVIPPTYSEAELPGPGTFEGGLAYVTAATPYLAVASNGVWQKLTMTPLAVLAETQAIIDEGWTPTSDAVKFKVDGAIRSLIATGLWGDILAMWHRSSLLNWKDPTANAMVAVGSPLFVEDSYFAGLGTDTDYYDTSLNLSTGGAGIYTQNSAGLWVWSLTESTSASAAEIGVSGDARVQVRIDTGKLAVRSNTGSTLSEDTTSSIGFFGWSRRASDDVSLYRNGVLLRNSAAHPSSAVTSGTFKVGRAAAGTGSAKQLGLAIVTAGLTDTEAATLYSIMSELMT
jgi:hypothetical protein